MKYLRPLAFTALFVTAAFTAAACGKSNPTGDDSGGDNGGSTTLSNGSMSASIAGSSFNANGAIVVSYIPGAPPFLVASGADTQGRAIAFGLFLSSTGTYTVSDQNAILVYIVGIGSAQWGADGFLYGGSGTITFTTFNATHAVGTGSFTGNPVAGTGATGTKSVTNFSFNITY